MNNAERRLSDGLHRLADDMHDEPIDLDSIRQGSRLDHSRSARTVVLAVAATIVAIALPVAAIVVIKHLNAETPPPTTTTTSPTTTTSSGALPTLAALPTPPYAIPTPRTPKPESVVTFSLTGLPTGAAPNIPYYSKGEFYPAGGGPGVPIQLGPHDAVGAFGRYGNGWVAIVSVGMDSFETRIYDAQGNQIHAYVAEKVGIAQGQDGSTAVALARGQLTLVDASGAVIHTWSVGSQWVSPVSVLPDHSVIFKAPILTISTQTSASWEMLRALPDGSVQALAWGDPFSVSQVNFDFTPGMGPPCATVFQIDPLQPRWTTCPYLVAGPFSPDGKLVAAYSGPSVVQNGKQKSYQEGSVAILDAATGAVKVRFVVDQPKQLSTVESVVWEDNTHILAMLYSNATQTVYPVRFGLDGRVDRASTAVLGLGMDGSYFLGEPLFAQ